MPITSIQAGKFLCEYSEWSLTKTRLQNLIYIAHMVYAGRHNDFLIDSKEPFEARNTGPTLRNLDDLITGYADRNVRNVFQRYKSIDIEEHKVERDILIESYEYFKEYEDWKIIGIIHEQGTAWLRAYCIDYPFIEFDDTGSHQIIPQPFFLDEYKNRHN